MTLRLAEVELREISLTLKEPFEISSGTTHRRRVLLLRLRDTDGYSAWSECVAGEFPSYSYETVDTAWLALENWLVPSIWGRSFGRPQEVWEHLDLRVRGHPMAKAALEMGCWGLHALRSEATLSGMLGGNRSTIATGISLGIQANASALQEKVRAAVKQGYQRIKLKIRPGADLDFVQAACNASDGRAVSVDANQAYSPSDLGLFRQLDRLGLAMIEQPLPADQLLDLARLQEELETPICLDESVPGPRLMSQILELRSGRVVNIKPGRVGGLSPALEIHDICRNHGIPVWCGGMLETGIGRSYNVALASLENFVLPGDLSPSARYWEHDIVSPEWTMSPKGEVEVPSALGLGVEVVTDRVENLTSRRECLRYK